MVEFVGLGPSFETCNYSLMKWLEDEYQIKADSKQTLVIGNSRYALWCYDVGRRLLDALNEWEDNNGTHRRYQYKGWHPEAPWDLGDLKN